MAAKKIERDARSGKFVTGRDAPSGKFVTVITDKKSGGKIGSYSVRTVDSKRFMAATRSANTVLRESTGRTKAKN